MRRPAWLKLPTIPWGGIMLALMGWYLIGREVLLVEATGTRYAIVSSQDDEFFIVTTAGARNKLHHGLRTIRVHFSKFRFEPGSQPKVIL